MSHKRCFVYLCSAFPIIGILCITSVVLYIFVMISLLLVFYVSQALFCISVFWFPYYWYFMSHKRCFVYLCYDFPIIGILCLTSVVLYICVMISHNWYFMFHKRCFVYLCYDFPIIGILCFTRVVLYICVLLSLLLVFYVSQALFCISKINILCYDFPIIGILCFTRLFCISVLWFPYYWYLCICFVYLSMISL